MTPGRSLEISLKYSGFKNGSLLHSGILDCLVGILHTKNALSAFGRGLLVRWLLDLYLTCKNTHMTHGCALGPYRRNDNWKQKALEMSLKYSAFKNGPLLI